jgi:alkylated DNA nucleotide flippase Atl1
VRPTTIDDDGIERMLLVVEAVPSGCVITYGDLSELAGYGGPRTAGGVMAHHGSGVPWHRVVSAQGRVPDHLQPEAVARWRQESTPLVHAGDRVDLRTGRWHPSHAELSALAVVFADGAAVGADDHDGVDLADHQRGARSRPRRTEQP